jgi:hypothetical protein
LAHFAKINENNVVEEVIVLSNDVLNEENISFPETETIGQDFIKNVLKLNGKWKQTSYNNNFRKQYGATGFTYNEENDVFIKPKPFPSWNLNENFNWVAPVPLPLDAATLTIPGKIYRWDEQNKKWELTTGEYFQNWEKVKERAEFFEMFWQS